MLNSLVKQGHYQKNEQNPNPLHAGISAKGLGKKINRSVSTGQRLITRLKKDKIIKVTPKFELVGYMTKKEFDFARANFIIPQWSVFNNDIVTKQTYSEMEIVERLFEAKIVQSLDGPKIIKAEKPKTKKTKPQCFLPFYMDRPKGYFSIGYLYKLGYSKQDAKKIFKAEIMSVVGLFGSRNIKLMSFRAFNKAKSIKG